MTGSHEVRGSIPLGSTNDDRSSERPLPRSGRSAFGDEGRDASLVAANAGRWSEFERRCRELGLDLLHSFALHRYQSVAAEGERIFDFSRPNAEAILIGNTRALWPIFLRALEREPARAREAHPLDAYVVTGILSATALIPVASRVFFAHTAEPRALPFQRMAEAAGLASLSPSHLSVHREFGPWFALRAVVVLDADYEPEERGLAEPLVSPCAGCERPCLTALADALERAQQRAHSLSAAVSADFHGWLRVREVCPEGRAHRYTDDQILYHYTKDRRVLSPAERPSTPK